jgi:hypothetical protein
MLFQYQRLETVEPVVVDLWKVQWEMIEFFAVVVYVVIE